MAMNSRPGKPLGMQRTLRGNAPAQVVNPVTATRQVAPRTTQKETVVIKNLSDLSAYTPDGKKKEKRFSAIITGVDQNGDYILKNAYSKIVWKDGKKEIVDQYIPRTTAPASAFVSANIGMTVTYQVIGGKALDFQLSDDMSAGLAVLAIAKSAPTCIIMTEAELLAWSNGVFKQPEYALMSNTDRIAYTLDSLTAKFGTQILRTTSNRNTALYIVNVTPANTNRTSDNTDNNASTTATGLTISTTATADNTDVTTTTATTVAA
jgi:hypothetical protein